MIVCPLGDGKLGRSEDWIAFEANEEDTNNKEAKVSVGQLKFF
jgi:hypothetical protein